ncbi:hypothetical protein CFE70_001734 [Pyrenophora teres f. teres 0-1]|uniref:Uncharacterized protein n=2 Tax=Pyrenophora teres f. teres TaxID=97479 RepID=E3S184_PYRTT|nr:hypothetical protein PTT_15937 [Pyrenophora teres f. teres 0-1]KAE8842285.1 hypothetical protein HRS9139_01582 [Pyrenophora teres f. teres]KAE8850642.1 hypothetical protein PTNB85_01058 [Pyrenophora teres f. teres]KAE8869996.1 hypothetical protein PTNB29_00340 [Pyrenophora teres f. teres]KAE8873707.1 hypothetical protein PTNB73_00339 [Pyrenophora teres f. teres]
MATTPFAPPSRRGDFLFSSVLYADPGNSNHHARASVAELAALLRPEALNLYSIGQRPAAATPAKDPAWHYYSAQLIHYGLPVTKEKNTAKVRLLNALNQFKLEVPAWVLKVESDLKKEWEAECRRVKKASAGAGAWTEVKGMGGKTSKVKTQAGESSGGGSFSACNGVNVTVNLNLSSKLGVSANSFAKKPSPAKRKRGDGDDGASNDTPKKAARVIKAPASKKASTTKEPAARKEPAPKKEPKVKKAPAPRSKVKKEEYEDPNDAAIMSGMYDITSDTASDIWQDYNLDLSLSSDPNRGVWWATFRWGAWDGIMRIQPTPDFSLFSLCELSWRMRDLETGKLTFGKRCTGDIEFFANKTLRGTLYDVPGAGGVQFQGTRMPGPAVQDDLQHEWDDFVKQAYRR